MLADDMNTVRAARLLEQAGAIGLALSGLSDDGKRIGESEQRRLESEAYGMHTEAWHRKKQALLKQRQEIEHG